MDRISQTRYRTSKDEPVVIDITPMNGAAGQRVEAGVHNTALANTGTDASPSFTFPSGNEVGKFHDLVLSFTFVGPDPDDAHYIVKVSGSGNEDYDGGTFRKAAGLNQRPQYEFEVTS